LEPLSSRRAGPKAFLGPVAGSRFTNPGLTSDQDQMAFTGLCFRPASKQNLHSSSSRRGRSGRSCAVPQNGSPRASPAAPPRAPPAGDVLAVRRPDGDFRCRFSSISGFTWGSPFRRLLQSGGTAQFKINVERTIDRLSERRHSGNGRSQLGQTAHSPSGRLAGSIWNWIFFRQALQQVEAKRRPIDEPGAKPSTPSSQR
jgi:hypothetical protein